VAICKKNELIAKHPFIVIPAKDFGVSAQSNAGIRNHLNFIQLLIPAFAGMTVFDSFEISSIINYNVA